MLYIYCVDDRIITIFHTRRVLARARLDTNNGVRNLREEELDQTFQADASSCGVFVCKVELHLLYYEPMNTKCIWVYCTCNLCSFFINKL